MIHVSLYWNEKRYIADIPFDKIEDIPKELDIDFNGSLLIRITKTIGIDSYYIINSMDGYGNNLNSELYEKRVQFFVKGKGAIILFYMAICPYCGKHGNYSNVMTEEGFIASDFDKGINSVSVEEVLCECRSEFNIEVDLFKNE